MVRREALSVGVEQPAHLWEFCLHGGDARDIGGIVHYPDVEAGVMCGGEERAQALVEHLRVAVVDNRDGQVLLH